MNENNKLTHGLLLEDFKQNLLNLISQHALDIQSKAIILDYVNMQMQDLSMQQTQKELDELKNVQKAAEKRQHEPISENISNTGSTLEKAPE